MAPPPTKKQKLASLPTMDTINDRSDSIDDINKEGEDDDSSSVSSGISCEDEDEVNDENDIVAHTINNDGKSAYELLREEKIARNNARLKELGLLTMKQPRKPHKRVFKPTPVLPARRSRRLDEVVTATASTTKDDGTMDLAGFITTSSIEPEGTNVVENELCTVLPLVEYQVMLTQHTEGTSSESYSVDDVQGKWNGIASLVSSTSRLVPPKGLTGKYSLRFCPSQYCRSSDNDGLPSPSWLVGAGKGGIITLWNCSHKNRKGYENIDPVISWKGGKSIADAFFLPPPPTTHSGGDEGSSTVAGGGVPSRLLTAGGNHCGTVCHWDLTSISVRTEAPKRLEHSGLHKSAICSMDISSRLTSSSFLKNISIVTGSKDNTIAVSTLDRLSDKPIWRTDFHRDKVGSVNFPSGFAHGEIPLIASASDDGLVAIHDARLNGLRGCNNCVVTKLEDIHVKPHSAIWMPGSSHIFMTGKFLLMNELYLSLTINSFASVRT
jgi:hypothetical protein